MTDFQYFLANMYFKPRLAWNLSAWTFFLWIHFSSSNFIQSKKTKPKEIEKKNIPRWTNVSSPCENSTGVITLVHTDWIMARLSRMLAEFLKRSACQHIKIGCYSTTLLYSSPKNFILKGMTSLFKVEKTSEIYVTQQQNIVSNDSSNQKYSRLR